MASSEYELLIFFISTDLFDVICDMFSGFALSCLGTNLLILRESLMELRPRQRNLRQVVRYLSVIRDSASVDTKQSENGPEISLLRHYHHH